MRRHHSKSDLMSHQDRVMARKTELFRRELVTRMRSGETIEAGKHVLYFDGSAVAERKVKPGDLPAAVPGLTPVLKAGVIYAADNGRLICLKCAGQSAKFTGRDISGQAVEVMTAEHNAAWVGEFDSPMVCERGCTTFGEDIEAVTRG